MGTWLSKTAVTLRSVLEQNYSLTSLRPLFLASNGPEPSGSVNIAISQEQQKGRLSASIAKISTTCKERSTVQI